MSSTKSGSSKHSSGSSISLIMGFSRSLEKGSFVCSLNFANYHHLVSNINIHGVGMLDII
ncbi:hypothetical protein ACTFIZ_003283 [Dictyostelium cf. discoideum]